MQNKIHPAYLLVDYIWRLLEVNNVSISKVNNIVPIFPGAPDPKVADSGKPYMIYGYADSADSRLPEIKRGYFALRINSATVAQVGEIINVISNDFENGSSGAEGVNLFAATIPAYADIRMGEVSFMNSDYLEPAEQEGGDVSGSITIAYSYVSKLNPVRPVPGGLWA